MNQIQETLNPFKAGSDDKNLYGLTTGKASSQVVKQDLLGCKDYGHKRCETFKDECLKNTARFEMWFLNFLLHQCHCHWHTWIELGRPQRSLTSWAS